MTVDPVLQNVGRSAQQWLRGAQRLFQDLQSSLASSVSGLPWASGQGKVFLMNKSSRKIESPKLGDVSKSDASLELGSWRRNPTWQEEKPVIEVTVPEGSLCELNSTFKVGLPPSAVFDILCDPGNQRVFKNIKEVTSREVLEDYGHRQVIDLEQAAVWRFLWLSGTLSVCVRVDQDRNALVMKYELSKVGFMKRFEGTWCVQPLYVDTENTPADVGRVASLVFLRQVVQPAVMPPPPFLGYVRGITTRTTEKLLEDLQAEGRRLREGKSIDAEYSADEKAERRLACEKRQGALLRRHWKISRNPGRSSRRGRIKRRAQLL